MYHCFTLKHVGLANILKSSLSIALPSLAKDSPKFQTECIWDTGCSKTTITQEVVDALGLIPTGFDYTNTASERNKKVFTYEIDLFLSDDLVFPNMTVNQGVILDGIGVLLGMDIIGKGDLSVTGLNGNSCMSFRYPSMHQIDFVDMANKAQLKRQFPNERCNCGSGRKFKDCHGKR